MKPRLWIAFSALCLLSGSQWLFDQTFPGMLGGLQRTALHSGLLAIAFGAIGLPRASRKVWLGLAICAAAMFGVPEVVFAASSGHVPDETAVLALMLAPVAVTLTIAQQSSDFGADEGPWGRMIPALAAIGGATLLIPLELPASAAGRLWLVATLASVVAAAVAAVRMRMLLAGIAILPGAALVALVSGALAAGFWSLGSTGPIGWSWGGAAVEILRCIVLDGPILLLTVWLLREMKPIAVAARFLLIPMVTIVEGIAAMRPEAGWTTAAGLILMVGGGIWLVRSGSE